MHTQFPLAFAINLLTLRAQNELLDKRTKEKYEKLPRDIVTTQTFMMLWSIVDYPLIRIFLH